MTFTCPRCGVTSHHPTDEVEGYCGVCHAFTGSVPVLSLWTIFDRPLDYPEHVVAREFVVLRGHNDPVATPTVIVGASIDEVRALLPPDLMRLHRDPIDHPTVVETWL